MNYPVDPGWFDEAFAPDGEPRAHYRPLIEALDSLDLTELARAVSERVAECGVGFRAEGSTTPFIVDPVPRLIEAAEWRRVIAATEQRVRALNAFLADVYSGEQRIVEAGLVPERVIASSEHFEPALVGVAPPPVAHVAGLDLVRGSDGALVVLEDNLRSPSGIAYALAAREAVAPRIPGIEPGNDPGATVAVLGEALRAAAPPGLAEAQVVVLTDGPESPAGFEHRALAEQLGVRLATPAELEARDGGIWLRDEDGDRAAVGVLYRRTEEDRLTRPDGSPTDLAELLLPAIKAGSVASVNSFGTGLADDKLVHAYVEAMIGFYLEQEPLIASVRTYDLGDPAQRSTALTRVDHLVVKPRSGLGGSGVVILPHTTTAQARRVQAQLTHEPGRLVAQEMVRLSRHPTAAGKALSPRHVDLRPYAFTIADRVEAAPVALTRYAREAGSMVVNSSRGGGGKDTWVLGR
ncbi:MAG: circularly permuted type 2 ATP-grasp protein [Solirubrobacterales bacterium]